MAVCECGREMHKAKGCGASGVLINGKEYKRIKFGSPLGEDARCHDCNALTGHYHHWGCDTEICPACNCQLFCCDCEDVALIVVKRQTQKSKKPIAIAYSGVKGTKEEKNLPLCHYMKYVLDHELKRLGAELVVWFVDYTCSDKPEDRPELQKMLRLLSEYKVDYVIMPSLEMLSPETGTQIKLSDTIVKSGAQIVSMSDSDFETYRGLL